MKTEIKREASLTEINLADKNVQLDLFDTSKYKHNTVLHNGMNKISKKPLDGENKMSNVTDIANVEKLKIFDFTFGENQIRIRVDDNNDPWFCAKDACKALGLVNSRKATAVLGKDDLISSNVTDTLGRSQSATFMNEAGLYELISNSRKPEARKFKRWITHDVLPSIRKTGKYEYDKAKDRTGKLEELANSVLLANEVLEEIREENRQLAKKNEKQHLQLEKAKDDSEYLRRVEGIAESLTPTQFAKIIKVKPRSFTTPFYEKFAYQSGRGWAHLALYNNYLETTEVLSRNGKKMVLQTKIKPDGRRPIYNWAKDKLGLPDIPFEELFPVNESKKLVAI